MKKLLGLDISERLSDYTGALLYAYLRAEGLRDYGAIQYRKRRLIAWKTSKTPQWWLTT